MINNELTKSKLTVFWISSLLILFSTSPSFMLNERSMNMFLITAMALSPLILLLAFRSIGKEDILIILFLLSITIFPLLNHPETMRWSTIIFSWMFGLTFLSYKHLLLKGIFQLDNFLKLLRFLIYCYMIILVIQQFCVLVGLPVFLASHYNIGEPWKLNSLAAEPSWAARSIAFLMFCNILVKEIILDEKYNFKNNFKDDKYLWLSFFWTMLTMGSGTAFLFIIIVLSVFLRFKTLFLFILIVLTLFGLISFFDIAAADRTIKLILATLTFDSEAIMEADRSGSARIVPFFVLIENINIMSIDDWFGHGVDYVGNNLYIYFPSPIKGNSGGGLFQVWMEYGFLSFLLLIMFSFKTIMEKINLQVLIFWFFLVFSYGINSQPLWLFTIFIFTINYFSKQKLLLQRKAT